MGTHQKSKPSLRFSEFTGEWDLCELDELFKERTEWPTLELPLYSLTIESGIVPKTERYERGFLVKSEEDAYKVMHPNDFAFNPMNLRFGALARFKGNRQILVSKYYNIFYCTSKSDPTFCENYLTTHNMIQFYNKMSTGSLAEKKRVHFLDFLKFRLRFPSLPEQKRIAAFLSSVDEWIGQLAKKKQLLLKYKKGVMQQIFDQKTRFNDDNSNDFPDWQPRRFDEVFSFLPTNSFSREDLNYEEGTVKNIHYGDIHTKFRPLFDVDRERVPFINRDIRLNGISDGSYCEEGDLVFADASEDYADVGKCIEITNLSGQRVVAGLHTLLARPKDKSFASGFAGYLMKSWASRRQIMREAQGTKVLGISAGRLSKIKIFLPSVPEQQKVASFISSLDERIEIVQQQIESTIAFKKALLHQMFV